MINKTHPYCEECETFALKSEVDRSSCPRCGNEWIMKSVKMSKSLGNTVDPMGIMEKYGADSARFFILFGASPESGLEWSDEGVSFAYKFINNTYQLLVETPESKRETKDVRDKLITYFLHKTIRDVTENLDNLSIRDAVNSIIQFTNELIDYKNEGVNEEILDENKKKLIKLLHPIIPHLTEEIWEGMGNESYLSLSDWPEFDESVLNDENEFKWNLLKDVSDDIRNIKQATKKENIKKIKIIVAEDWKFEFYSNLMESLQKTKNQGKIMGTIMQNAKFKQHGQFISQTVTKVLKNVGKYAKYTLTPELEREFFQEVQTILESQFDARVQILREQDSLESKASQALPGRPAIIIS
jgi:leucyl-tRNA synthetase